MGVLGASNRETLSLASSNAGLGGKLGRLDALGPGESAALVVDIVDVAAAVSVVGDGNLVGGLGVGGILPDVESALATADLGLVTVARVVARTISGLFGSNIIAAVADTVVGETSVAEGVALADGSALLDSHVSTADLGAHNQGRVPIGVATLAGEGGEAVGTGRKLIVGGSGERGQRQGRGDGHDRPVEGHAGIGPGEEDKLK